MNSDKRNAAVVVALIASMTAGVLVLLAFENLLYPRRPRFEADIALTAEQRRGVEVEVGCAALDAATRLRENENVCLVYPDGYIDPSQAGGPQVRVVLVGADAHVLSAEHKRALLGTLHALLGAAGTADGHVRLAAADGEFGAPENVRDFLVLKGFLPR